MIIGIGTDVTSVSRIQKLMEKHPHSLHRVFSEEELRVGGNQRDTLAGYFAAKEAFAKAMGTGFGKDLQITEVSVKKDALGKPFFVLSERLSELFDHNGHTAHLSISHDGGVAMAVVIIEK